MTLTILSLVLVFVSCVFILRSQYMSMFFHSRVLSPWREAIEKQNFAACQVYDQVANDFVRDWGKLVFQPWKKLPSVWP